MDLWGTALAKAVCMGLVGSRARKGFVRGARGEPRSQRLCAWVLWEVVLLQSQQESLCSSLQGSCSKKAFGTRVLHSDAQEHNSQIL